MGEAVGSALVIPVGHNGTHACCFERFFFTIKQVVETNLPWSV